MRVDVVTAGQVRAVLRAARRTGIDEATMLERGGLLAYPEKQRAWQRAALDLAADRLDQAGEHRAAALLRAMQI